MSTYSIVIVASRVYHMSRNCAHSNILESLYEDHDIRASLLYWSNSKWSRIRFDSTDTDLPVMNDGTRLLMVKKV